MLAFLYSPIPKAICRQKFC